jgi:hypothetical protein
MRLRLGSAAAIVATISPGAIFGSSFKRTQGPAWKLRSQCGGPDRKGGRYLPPPYVLRRCTGEVRSGSFSTGTMRSADAAISAHAPKADMLLAPIEEQIESSGPTRGSWIPTPTQPTEQAREVQRAARGGFIPTNHPPGMVCRPSGHARGVGRHCLASIHAERNM